MSDPLDENLDKIGVRADLVLTKTPFGAVVEDVHGTRWVFVGWTSNRAGWEMNFIEELKPSRFYNVPHCYHASMAETLIGKFPALQQYRKAAE